MNQLIVRDERCNHNTNRMAIEINYILMQLSQNLSICTLMYVHDIEFQSPFTILTVFILKKVMV